MRAHRPLIGVAIVAASALSAACTPSPTGSGRPSESTIVVTPASWQMSSMRDVSATSRLPIFPKRSRPPTVIVPKLSTDRLSPELPRRRCSISTARQATTTA